jgi:hypothetical protein
MTTAATVRLTKRKQRIRIGMLSALNGGNQQEAIPVLERGRGRLGRAQLLAVDEQHHNRVGLAIPPQQGLEARIFGGEPP